MRLRAIILCIGISIFSTAVFGQPIQVVEDPIPNQSEPNIVNVAATEYAFAMPSEIKSGWVTFRFNNIGKETHVAQILHLKNDISFSEYDSLKKANPGRFIPPVDKLMGGPGLHTAGQSSDITVNLPPGSYLMACGVSNKEGTQHLTLGMLKYFRVIKQPGAESPPIADMQIALKNYQIKMDGKVSKGSQTIEIEGSETDFDVHLIALEDSSTLEEAFSYFRDLRDPHQAKIVSGVEEGYTSYITNKFSPGDYAWSSHEYGQYGMYQKFSITEEGEQILKEGVVTDEIKNVDVRIADKNLELPSEMAAGRKQMHVHVDDSRTHKLRFARLKEGRDLDDYLDWIRKFVKGEAGTDTRPRIQYFLQFGSLERGEEGSLTAELFPGRYILYCNTAVGENSYHLLEGEIKEITVK